MTEYMEQYWGHLPEVAAAFDSLWLSYEEKERSQQCVSAV